MTDGVGGKKTVRFTIPLGGAGAAADGAGQAGGAANGGAAQAVAEARKTFTSTTGVSVTVPAGMTVRFLSDPPFDPSTMTPHATFVDQAGGKQEFGRALKNLASYGTIDDVWVYDVKRTLAKAFQLPSADFSIDFDQTRGTAFEDPKKITLDLGKQGVKEQKVEIDLESGVARFFQDGALVTGTVDDFKALQGLATAPVPPAIAGTKDGEHPDDDWSAKIMRHFHAPPHIPSAERNHYNAAAFAARNALAAPVATAIPEGLRRFALAHPAPPGSTVRFSVQEVEGQKLYAYLRLTPREGVGEPAHELDLQLYSTQGRVAGVMMTMIDEFLPPSEFKS